MRKRIAIKVWKAVDRVNTNHIREFDGWIDSVAGDPEYLRDPDAYIEAHVPKLCYRHSYQTFRRADTVIGRVNRRSHRWIVSLTGRADL